MTHPEGYTELDLVGFTDRGTYASNISYVKNDIAHYAGSLYRCKIDDTINVTPGENANWTVFIGEPQSLVERIIAPLEDNPATVAYATGRQIIYDDYLWEVIDDIAVGDPLVDYDVDPTNANIKKSIPVETQLLEVKAREGNLADLTTAAKANLVAAVNEVKADTGTNASAITATKQMIAPIETTLTASQPYAIGEQFVYNGLLYKATAAIAQGGTITIDGNCEFAYSVTEQIGGLATVINSRVKSIIISSDSKNVHTLTFSASERHVIFGLSANNSNSFAAIVVIDSSKTVRYISLGQGNNVTLSGSSDNSGIFTITLTGAAGISIIDLTTLNHFPSVS